VKPAQQSQSDSQEIVQRTWAGGTGRVGQQFTVCVRVLLLLQVEAHCRAEKEKLLKSDVEKGKVHAGAAAAAAAAVAPATMAGVSGVMQPGAAVMHPGAMPHPVAVSAAALVTDGEWLVAWGSTPSAGPACVSQCVSYGVVLVWWLPQQCILMQGKCVWMSLSQGSGRGCAVLPAPTHPL
jgi:hypothetical protein